MSCSMSCDIMDNSSVFSNYIPDPVVSVEPTNPFYVGVDGGSLLRMRMKDIYKYPRVLILCSKKNTKIATVLHEQILDMEEYVKCACNYTLIPVDISILSNYSHKKHAVIVEKHYLIPLNNNEIDLLDNEIVIVMYDINTDIANLYAQLYGSDVNLEALSKLYSLRKRYKVTCANHIVQSNMAKQIANLKDTNYWCSAKNCNINMTNAFSKRLFNIKHKLNDNEISITNNNENLLKEKSYHFINGSAMYIDALTAIKNCGGYYGIEYTTTNMDTSVVHELFRTIESEREMYNIFNMLALSKKYCHLVLNNENVLNQMGKLFKKYLPIYKYIIGYSWLYMYLEECIIKSKTTTKHRYVYDINTASKLPYFPMCKDDIHMNPYITLLVDSEVINSNSNCHGMGMLSGYDYGIDTLDGFRKKLNICTTGRTDICIFDGLETVDGSDKWKNFAIGGSIMPSCIEKQNPLFDIVSTSTMSNADRWNKYFNTVHKLSDIDVMCTKKNIIPFMDETYKLINVINTNLRKIHDCNPIINVRAVKTMLVTVHPLYIEKAMLSEFDTIDDDFNSLDKIKENINDTRIKLYFYTQYIVSKNKFIKKFKQSIKNKKENPIYKHFYERVREDDMNIYVTQH